MFFDLNVVVPTPGLPLPSASLSSSTKKGKGKQNANAAGSAALLYTPAQVAAIEARVDLLVHLGYTVLALNQVVQSKVDVRTHVDWLAGLVGALKRRTGIAVLRRLTVVMDAESERGHGITPQNAALLAPYDILAVEPHTQAALSLACLNLSQPSAQTVHVISVPVTLPPRLPFHMRHTLVRSAARNGVVFEVGYSGALGAEKARWWGGAREVVRVTRGRGVVLGGGGEWEGGDGAVRAPRDVANMAVLLGVAQDVALAMVEKNAKVVVSRAQSRKTYRATLSEPTLILPPSDSKGKAKKRRRAEDEEGDSASDPQRKKQR